MRLHAIDVAADDLVVLAGGRRGHPGGAGASEHGAAAQLDAHVRGSAAIVTDTGSTKRDIVEAARALPATIHLHRRPSARRRSASAASNTHGPTCFAGRPWLFTPAGDAPAEAVEKLAGVRHRRSVAPPRHDAADARPPARLPQSSSAAGRERADGRGRDAVGDEGLALAGRGLVDTTRLASSPADIWRDIAATNADQIGAALDGSSPCCNRCARDLDDGEPRCRGRSL